MILRNNAVQALSRRKPLKLREMTGLHGRGNRALLPDSFAQVNQPAALRTEPAELARKPAAGLVASRAFDLAGEGHGGFADLTVRKGGELRVSTD
jgi:hypothetical protein